MTRALLLAGLVASGCAAVSTPVTTGETFGDSHQGSYHLGPVDWSQSQWTNSCAPYPLEIQRLQGSFLAGVDTSLNGGGQLCDACALVTTGLGKSLLVRIITTGASKSPGDMDLSPEAYQLLVGDDAAATPSNPRPMTWKLAKCPANGPIHLQFQTQANPWWTSFWVRNPRLPVERVEVQSSKHASFFALRREADGSWNDDGGFGEGSFTLRLTAVGGATVTQTFSSFSPGALVETTMQFE